MSPPPALARLPLSDNAFAANDRASLLVRRSGDERLRAVAFSDLTSGVLAGSARPDAALWQSPDGRQYILEAKIYDRDGRDLGALPWRDPKGSLPTWSGDGQLLCLALPETQRTGSAMQLQTAIPGQPARIIAAGYGTYSDNAVYPVLACDPTTDLVVVASLGQGLFAGRLWVFRLSTGELIRSETLGVNAAVSWLVASADGRLLAHSVRAEPTGPTTTTIRTVDSPTPIQTILDFEAHGFSGDGSLLIGIAGTKTIAIVDRQTGRRIWSATGLPYGGYFPEPGGAHIAVGVGFVGPTNDGDVYIVGPDGTSVLLPAGLRVLLRY